MAKKQEDYFSNIPFMGLRNVENWMGGFRAMGVDANTMMEVQRRNIEALGDINRMWVGNMQAIMQKNTEMLRESMEESTRALSKMNANPDQPQETVEEQMKVTQNSLEKSLEHLRELAEMGEQSSSEIMKTLNSRFYESLDEIQSALHSSGEEMKKEMKAASESGKKAMEEATKAASKSEKAKK